MKENKSLVQEALIQMKQVDHDDALIIFKLVLTGPVPAENVT